MAKIRNSKHIAKITKHERIQDLNMRVHARLMQREFWLEQQKLIVQEVELPKRVLGKTICLVGDIHADSQTMTDEKLLELEKVLAQIDCDYYAAVGDFVNDLDLDRIPAVAKMFERLPSPTFAVLGNHDHNAGPERITKELERRGVVVLNNDAVKFDNHWILGVDSWWKKKHDFEAAYSKVVDEDPVVVLGHEPVLATMHEAYLHLAGHSHHGQVRVHPGQKRMMLPRGSKPFPKGLYEVDQKRYVYTTAGVGVSNFPLRVHAPPEVVIIYA